MPDMMEFDFPEQKAVPTEQVITTLVSGMPELNTTSGNDFSTTVNATNNWGSIVTNATEAITEKIRTGNFKNTLNTTTDGFNSTEYSRGTESIFSEIATTNDISGTISSDIIEESTTISNIITDNISEALSNITTTENPISTVSNGTYLINSVPITTKESATISDIFQNFTSKITDVISDITTTTESTILNQFGESNRTEVAGQVSETVSSNSTQESTTISSIITDNIFETLSNSTQESTTISNIITDNIFETLSNTTITRENAISSVSNGTDVTHSIPEIISSFNITKESATISDIFQNFTSKITDVISDITTTTESTILNEFSESNRTEVAGHFFETVSSNSTQESTTISSTITDNIFQTLSNVTNSISSVSNETDVPDKGPESVSSIHPTNEYTTMANILENFTSNITEVISDLTTTTKNTILNELSGSNRTEVAVNFTETVSSNSTQQTATISTFIGDVADNITSFVTEDNKTTVSDMLDVITTTGSTDSVLITSTETAMNNIKENLTSITDVFTSTESGDVIITSTLVDTTSDMDGYSTIFDTTTMTINKINTVDGIEDVTIYVIIGIVLAVLILATIGLFICYRKNKRSCNITDNYYITQLHDYSSSTGKSSTISKEVLDP